MKKLSKKLSVLPLIASISMAHAMPADIRESFCDFNPTISPPPHDHITVYEIRYTGYYDNDGKHNPRSTIDGKVVAVGTRNVYKGITTPLIVKNGDFITFANKDYTKINFDDREYFTIKESDILKTIEVDCDEVMSAIKSDEKPKNTIKPNN